MQEIVAANWRSLIRPKGRGQEVHRYIRQVRRASARARLWYHTGQRASSHSPLQSPSAAIKTVKIEGVLHEFSSIPGVVDDVTNIVLNLKQVRIRTSSNEVLNGHIDKTCGEGETVDVTAGDIRFDGEARCSTQTWSWRH